MPVTEDEFRSALSRFASGVTVVTTKDSAGNFHGITVSSFCSVSLKPPMILVCIEKTTGSHYAFNESDHFVVNILDVSQKEVSERFASTLPNKFDGVEFELNLESVPVLAGCVANLECRLRMAWDGGDHTIFVGEVEKVTVFSGDPLIYFYGDYRRIAEH
jgi:flavin reductase (DIM6/NTAB) family NADH-FMN oxidoreductase RutF